MRYHRRPVITYFPRRVVPWALAVLLLVMPLGAAAQPTSSVRRLIERGTEAGIDAPLMEQIAQRVDQAGFGPGQSVQLLRPAVDLAEQDLPAQTVLRKALEGLAKRVPPSRIRPVLQRLHTHTQQAGALVEVWTEQPSVREMMGEAGTSALDGEARDQLVASAAQARAQNVPPDVVERLLETLPAETGRRPISPGDVVAAVQVLPELLDNGASPQATIQLLTSAVDAGYGPANLRQLPTAIRVAQQRNPRPVDVLARNAARAVARGLPAADVLGRLFEGGLPGGPPGDVGGAPANVPPGQGKPPYTPGRDDPPPGQGRGNPPAGGTDGS